MIFFSAEIPGATLHLGGISPSLLLASPRARTRKHARTQHAPHVRQRGALIFFFRLFYGAAEKLDAAAAADEMSKNAACS